jgi:hypothetical protein
MKRKREVRGCSQKVDKSGRKAGKIPDNPREK